MIRKMSLVAVLIVLILVLGFAGGTVFYPMDSRYSQKVQISLPEDLDSYLQKSEEALHPKAHTQKEIIWAYPDHRKTPLSLVYLHGFSATRKEISPVTEDLAKKLNANVFFTRFSGHGLGGEGMGAAKGYQWVADAAEALEIGKRLGEKVVILGYSTGAALSVPLAELHDPNLAGVVMMAPNFRPQHILSPLSAGPLGVWITNLVTGGKNSFATKNADHAYYWTSAYPAIAIHELMELLKYVNSIDAEKMSVPLLMVYSPRDKVVSVPEMLKKYQAWGSANKKLVEFKTGGHLFAGNIIAPEGNEALENEILDFIRTL